MDCSRVHERPLYHQNLAVNVRIGLTWPEMQVGVGRLLLANIGMTKRMKRT